MSEATSEHADHIHNTKQGITFFWAVDLLAMIVLIAVFALSDLGGDVIAHEIDSLAIGSVNAMGLVALGGINAMGVVSLGMVNSLGVVSIGGVNSLGLIAIGGYNAAGVVTIGGVNSFSFPVRIWSATVFDWNPRVKRAHLDPA